MNRSMLTVKQLSKWQESHAHPHYERLGSLPSLVITATLLRGSPCQLQRITIHRELDIPLDDIKKIMDAVTSMCWVRCKATRTR
jgi:hypothetical protein